MTRLFPPFNWPAFLASLTTLQASQSAQEVRHGRR